METPNQKKNQRKAQVRKNLLGALAKDVILDPNLVLPRCKRMKHHNIVDEETPQVLEKLPEKPKKEIPKALPKFILSEEILVFCRNEDQLMTEVDPKTQKKVQMVPKGRYSLEKSEQEKFCYNGEYDEDNYIYDREMESKYTLRQHFLYKNEITTKHRENAMDYLVNICNFLELPVEILHSSVAIIDRFLQKEKRTPLDFLKLLVLASLRIALKIEHRQNDLPDTEDLVILSEKEFSAWQIVAMEKKIMGVLKFTLIYPSSIAFLRRCNRLKRVTVLQHYLSFYLLEIGFLNYRICATKPSLQAAAACCLSVALLENETDFTKIWSSEMVKSTSYKVEDLRPVIDEFVFSLDRIESVGKNSSVYKKYAHINNFRISTYQQLLNIEYLYKYLSNRQQ